MGLTQRCDGCGGAVSGKDILRIRSVFNWIDLECVTIVVALAHICGV
jgi:hypothetical protein